MKDGVYLEVFAVVKGNRFNFKSFLLDELAHNLTEKMMDGIFEVVGSLPEDLNGSTETD